MTTLPDPTSPDEPARPGDVPPPTDPGPAADPAVLDQPVVQEAAEVLERAELTEPGSLADLDRRRRMLLVHAHPDDETITNGATMARYAALGVQVTLVTCTLGEEGEVLVPELAHLAADRENALGAHRASELATAMEALGVEDFRFLGGAGRYRDSGMMGTPSNERPDCFWHADLDQAAAELVPVIREVRPQVLVTYDPDGGYGHPDHIQAHRVAMRAAELAADGSHGRGAPWTTPKIYWNAVPRSVMLEFLTAMPKRGDTSFAFEAMDSDGEMPAFVVPDEQVTTRVDGTAYVDAKVAAMRAHATQIAVDGPFFALSNNIGQKVWAEEYYRLARGELGECDGADGRETDLFAGVD